MAALEKVSRRFRVKLLAKQWLRCCSCSTQTRSTRSIRTYSIPEMRVLTWRNRRRCPTWRPRPSPCSRLPALRFIKQKKNNRNNQYELWMGVDDERSSGWRGWAIEEELPMKKARSASCSMDATHDVTASYTVDAMRVRRGRGQWLNYLPVKYMS